jgi:hypothetical protein
MNTIRWAVVAACLGLLAACGGGGGGGKKPPTPQSETPTEAPPQTTLSATYMVAASPDGRDLAVIDPSNQRLVDSIDIDQNEDAWATARARSQSSNGLTQTDLHETALYYIQDKQVQALDLTRSSSAITPKQISSITDACGIFWQIEGDLTGKDSWLAIKRAGSDAQCGTNDDDFSLVHSSWSASTAPEAVPFNLAGLVTVGRDAAGRLESLITFEPAYGRFGHWRLDSNGPHPTAETNGHTFPANAYIRWLGLVPGHRDRGIVQVDDSLRLLSWTNSSTTLSSSLATSDIPYGNSDPYVTADASRMYVITEQSGWQIVRAFGATGPAVLIATLDADKGAAIELKVSSDAVWVVQKDDIAPGTPSTLTAFDKVTGAWREEDHYEVPPSLAPAELSLKLMGVHGSKLAYTKPSEDEDDDVSLYLIDHVGATPQLLADRAYGIGAHVGHTALLGQPFEATHLLWCDKGTLSLPVNCTPLRFKSYNLATGAVTALGQGVSDDEASAVLSAATTADLEGFHPLITAEHDDMSTTTQWLFKPDVAGSLRFIIGRGSSSAGSGSSGSSSSP